MDSIDKWLKSLRLHKYTHLFKTLTYDQMLNLEERYLIDLDITKGARNKMLVSIKKLNLRQEKLINMMEDIDSNVISMKEALNVLRDMLITPIPSPESRPNNGSQLSLLFSPTTTTQSTTNSTSLAAIESNQSDDCGSPTSTTMMSSSSSSSPATSPSSLSDIGSPPTRLAMIPNSGAISSSTNTTGASSTLGDISNLDPYGLTYLFIETFEKVAKRLIESAGLEDNACHGIMATIVDDCLKHNSFTREQKARVASFRQHFVKEQKAKTASYKNYQQVKHNHHHHYHHPHHHQHHNHLSSTNTNNGIGNHNHQYQQQQQQRAAHAYNHINYTYYTQNQFHNHNRNSTNTIDNSNITNIGQNDINHYQQHKHQRQQRQQWSDPIQKPHSLSTVSSVCSSIEEERQTYKEYSLLGPGKTFELPCLRALAELRRHNRP